MKFILAFFSFFLSLTSYAETLNAHLGEQIALGVMHSGVTLEFSEPVKAISGSGAFRIVAIGADVDEKTRVTSNARVFSIAPSSLQPDELVTFVFATPNGGPSSLLIHLSLQEKAPTYWQVNLAKPTEAMSYKGYLARETQMMAAMIRDDDTFGRKVVETGVKFPGISNLNFKVVRRFESDNLIGFTFLITNTSRIAVAVTPSSVNFAKNAAVLAQVDHETLEPCSKNNSNIPTQNSCTTAFRILVRTDEPNLSRAFPFVKASLKTEETAQ